jgi:hypothetical protein
MGAGKSRMLMSKVVYLPVEDVPKECGCFVIQIMSGSINRKVFFKGEAVQEVPLYQTTEGADGTMACSLDELRYGVSQRILGGDNG